MKEFLSNKEINILDAFIAASKDETWTLSKFIEGIKDLEQDYREAFEKITIKKLANKFQSLSLDKIEQLINYPKLKESKSLGTAYFHIENGGIIFSVENSENEPPLLKIEANHFEAITNKMEIPTTKKSIKELGEFLIKISENLLEKEYSWGFECGTKLK